MNKGFITPDLNFIRWIPIIVILLFILMGITSFIGDYFIGLAARNVVLKLRQNLFDKILKLPSSYLDQHASSQLVAAMIYNAEQVMRTFSNALLTVLKDGFYMLSLFIVMLINSWVLALLFLSISPLIFFVLKLTGSYMRKMSLKVQEAIANITHITQETLEGYKVVKSFNGIDYQKEKIKNATEDVRNKQIKVLIANSLGNITTKIITAFVIALTIYIAIFSPHKLSAGAFISSLSAMLVMLKPLQNLTNINRILQKGLAGAKSIFDVLDEQSEHDTGTKMLKKPKGMIEYNQITFRYPGTLNNVFNNFSLKIYPGETIALFGPSGTGKTTLINLLLRFYNYQDGSITIDGHNIQEIKIASLRDQISLVSQDVTLFNDTIGNNIAYGCLQNASQENIYQAAKAAHLIDFTDKLPEGLNTSVGENGILVSGGQRQRIAIARAFLKNAPILVFDEATSHLDTNTESLVHDSLNQLKENRTTIIIGHQLSTLKKADRILQLQHGTIVEMDNYYDHNTTTDH